MNETVEISECDISDELGSPDSATETDRQTDSQSVSQSVSQSGSEQEADEPVQMSGGGSKITSFFGFKMDYAATTAIVRDRKLRLKNKSREKTSVQ